MSKMVKVKTYNNFEREPNFQKVKTFHNYESDEKTISEYLKNLKPSDMLSPHMKNLGNPSAAFTPETASAPSAITPSSVIPASNYASPATVDALKRQRYKAMDMDNFASDLDNALKTYEKVSGGWQDAETMKESKTIIEKARDRLVQWQKYNNDYNIGIDYSEHLKAYSELLGDWDEIAKEYAEYEDAKSYEKDLKESEKTRKEIQEVPVIAHESRIAYLEYCLEVANGLYGDLYHAQQMTSNATTPEMYEEYSKKEQEALKECENYLRMIGFGTKEEMEKEISRLKGIRKQAEIYQKIRDLSDVANPDSENYDKDFEKYVKKGNEIDFHDVDEAEKYVLCLSDKHYAAMALAEFNGFAPEQGTYVMTGDGIYKYFKPEEFEILAYYIVKDEETGGNQTQEYLDLMKEELETRKGNEFHDKYLKDNTFLEVLYSVPVNLDRFANNLVTLFNTEDDYIPLNSTQVAGQLAREDLADNGVELPEWLGGASAAQVTYDALGTTAYMLPSILVGFVSKTAGAALMGAASAGNAYQEAINAGMDKGQARTYSTLVGVSEAAMSRVLSKVFGGKAVSGKVTTAIKGVENGLARWALNTGVAFASEATEEGLQEILTPIFENIALGYNKNGFEDIDWSEVTYSALLGGLSGGAFETLGSGVNRIKNGINVKRDYNTDSKVTGLLKLSLSFDKNSKAYKLANKYSAEFTKNKGISSRKVYNLANTLQNTVGYTLMKLGETDNADTLASVIVKKLSGVELSVKEIELLSKSSYGQETLNTYTPKAEVGGEVSAAAEVSNADTNAPVAENLLQGDVDNGIINNNQETGVDIDGSTNPELLAGREVPAVSRSGNGVRQQSENSRKISYFVEGTSNVEGNGSSTLRAGDSGWLVQHADQEGEVRDRFEEGLRGKILRVAPSGFDTIGRKISSEIKEKFKNTIFKDNNGNLLSLYHWTQATFEYFAKGEFGFHFGTLDAAHDRYTQSLEEDFNTQKGIYKEVYLNIKSPYFMVVDAGEWSAQAVALQLEMDGLITEQQYDHLRLTEGWYDNTYDNPAAKAVRDILNNNGYDGIIYKNDSEDAGSYSVIALYPEQILTVAENGVLKEDSGVTEADPEGPANFMPESEGSSLTSSDNASGNDVNSESGRLGRDVGEIADFGGLDTNKGKHLDKAQQDAIKEIGNKLNREVVFEDFYSSNKFKGKKKIPDGYLAKDGTVHINYYAKRPVQFLLKHEITHYLKRSVFSYQDFMNLVFDSSAFGDWLAKKGHTMTSLKAEITDTYSEVENFNEGRCYDEILADFVGEYLFGGENTISQKLINALQPKQKKSFCDVIKSIIDYFKSKFQKNKPVQTEIENIENEFIKVYKEAVEVKTDEVAEESYSFIGYAEDGRGKYKSNFPKGTPKMAKADKILNYIQNVWSKKPIKLKIEENGNVKYIEAKFDPTYDESGNIPTDASKLMGGNRHGTSSEQRVTLDLADDYYQIASESQYNYSKDETGRDNPAHKDVTRWHYFINDIYFAEYDSDNYEPYRVSINVKERADGEYVYSFSAEKQRESDTPRTLHAVVNERETPNANVELSNNKVTQSEPIVKNNISKDGEDYSIPSSATNRKSILTDLANGEITVEEAEKLLSKSTQTHSGENLRDTADSLKPKGNREWSAFNRSFANQTNGLKSGGSKSIIIHTAQSQYLVLANGYMSGKIVSKINIDEYNESGDFYDNFRTKIFDSKNEGNRNRQGNNNNSGVSFENKRPNPFDVELDEFIRNHPDFFRNNRESYEDYKRRIAQENKTEADFYSIPSVMSAEDLLKRYENGEITRAEYLNLISRKKTLNPAEIANLSETEADTTATKRSRKQGESEGDGDSKFYGSLMESDIFDRRFKDEAKDDTFIQKYKTVTNKETLRKAAKELDEGGRYAVERWWALTPERANLIDTAMGFILMDRYQRVGDYESAIAAAEKVREFGTASGQQVQIFSILGRLDPNTMAVYAQNELTKAYEIMIRGKTKKWIQRNESKFLLTDEDVEFIRLRTIQAAQLPEGRDKAIRLAEIAARIEDKLPPERGRGIKAWQRISMLLNAKTQIRNITGNGIMVPVFIASDFFGSGIDKMVSHYTDVRTTGNFKLSSVKGIKKGIFETMDDFRRHINTRNTDMDRFEIGAGKSFNEQHKGILAKERNEIAKVLNALDRFTSFCLELGDRPFYEMWFINSLNNQMKLNNVDEATPEMVAIASHEALQRTWQDTNKMTKFVSGFRSGLNSWAHIGEYGLGDVFIKFTKTPANLTKAIFDFSPAGVVKAIAVDAKNLKNAIQTGRFEAKLQKQFVDSLSKGIAGTLLYVLVCAAVSAGYITGAGDEDKDVANFEKYIQGMPEYSVKIFGKWYSYDWAQPIGAVMATVADYMKAKEKNPDNEWHENILEAIESGGEVLYNQSFMQSIQMLFTADTIIDGVIEGALGEPSVFVPQLLSQFANATDDYRRVTYENDKSFQSTINRVKAKIPGLRQTLPKQIDVLGREVPNSQKSVFNAFLNPGNTYTDTSTPVTDEIYELYTKTKDKTLMPKVAPYSITVKGITKSFTIDEKNDFQRITGTTTSDILEIAIKAEGYKKLSDEQKIDFINNVYDFATKKAKSSFEYDYKTLSFMVGEYNNGQPILTEDNYNKLPEEAREMLAQEYFFTKSEIRYIENYEALIKYYISKIK